MTFVGECLALDMKRSEFQVPLARFVLRQVRRSSPVDWWTVPWPFRRAFRGAFRRAVPRLSVHVDFGIGNI